MFIFLFQHILHALSARLVHGVHSSKECLAWPGRGTVEPSVEGLEAGDHGNPVRQKKNGARIEVCGY